MTEAKTRSVVVERDFAYPPDRLWRALTQQHLIADWLMKNDFAPTVGHKFNLSGEWGGTLDCEVLAVEPGETLSYTWDHVHDDPQFDLRSVVTFTLTPTAAGTHLRMEQAGFRPDQPRASGGAKYGWQQNFDKLEDVLGRIS
ncbi:SRPBCC domain-containing protein [Sphingomonas bacterium]|uniref:SRPBCC family protein n=1 Tax=Sphingomonas bacterium TaxID=1895847 RepID=UPI002613751D|nr:SRPBCC domain-containing protein [Sphingomonas bacterium]MDB5678765.1 polyketide cyclase [Sphingomonas bacterium]